MRIFQPQPAWEHKPDQYHQSGKKLSEICHNQPHHLTLRLTHSSLFLIILPSIFFLQHIAAERLYPTPRAQSVTQQVSVCWDTGHVVWICTNVSKNVSPPSSKPGISKARNQRAGIWLDRISHLSRYQFYIRQRGSEDNYRWENLKSYNSYFARHSYFLLV
jgi:hypothetical protein